MAATIDDVVESKQEGSTPIDNSVMETAQAKGRIAIGIAKLQPSVRLLIAYTKLWAYYTLVPFKIGQLVMDVVVLGLEIAKLSLIAVKANTNIFVQLFQQILAIVSPEFIQNLLLSFSTILTTLVEKIMKDFFEIVQKLVDGLTNAFRPPFVPKIGFAEGKPGTHGAPTSSDTEVVTGPTSGGAAQQKPAVNGATPEKPTKDAKSDKTGKSEPSEKSETSTPKKA